MQITMGTLLGVTKGKLMGDIDDLYKFYNYYTGASVFTHQLPRLYEQTHKTIAAQYPFLYNIDLSDVTRDNWKTMLSNLVEEYGDSFDVARPLISKHLVKDPLEEAVDMFGEDRVIAISVEEEG